MSNSNNVKVMLTEPQAEVGVAAKMWTTKDMINAKKRPDGWIKDNYYLNASSSNGDSGVSSTQAVS
jgi:hypothetical protein